jgi:hypothetical protein
VAIDETFQREYAEKVLAWFRSGFTDQGAMPFTKLRDYGGMFDLNNELLKLRPKTRLAREAGIRLASEATEVGDVEQLDGGPQAAAERARLHPERRAEQFRRRAPFATGSSGCPAFHAIYRHAVRMHDALEALLRRERRDHRVLIDPPLLCGRR